jgi:putative ABC transport system permease protein
VTASVRSQRLRGLLVVSEMALALLLLVGAGLMIKSFLRLQRGDLGFNPKNVLTMQVILPGYKYDSRPKRLAFVQSVLQRVETLPGVQSAAATNFLPLSGFWGTATFLIEGRPLPKPGDEPEADNRVVTPNYFRTLGIRLVSGREFTERDRVGSPQVAIINETTARRFWPNENPIGKRVNWGDDKKPDWWEIVGVVGDVKAFGLEAKTHADVYRPLWQAPFPLIALTVRTNSDPLALAAAVRQEVWSVDKDQPIFKVLSMEQLAAESVTLRRVSMLLLGIFAGVALVLAAVGIYAVISYAVTQRRHEIGVRMALGASASDVVRLVVRQGMALALTGVGVGLVASFALTRVMSSLLYGVSATDPATFAAIALLLAAVALAACYLPARRAAKVDPMIALRSE